MKWILFALGLVLLPVISQAQSEELHQEVIVDTAGLKLFTACAEDHGRGVFWKHIDSVTVDTLVSGDDLIERTRDAGYSVYQCERCNAFYRYPQSGYIKETLLIIGKVGQ